MILHPLRFWQSGHQLNRNHQHKIDLFAHFLPELFTAPVFRTELEEENTA